MLYQDEKGPVAAKTHGGPSWCSVQTKIEKAQKTNGLLNVFGVYDHKNDQMYTHSYKNKTGDQFLDFIKRLDKKYDSSSVKQIFLVLDNASIHKSKNLRETIQRHHHRINFVFLPTRSPELNLIEVRWLWMQRQAINNSTFRNEFDIGKAVFDWTYNYNRKHGRRITDILQIGVMNMST